MLLSEQVMSMSFKSYMTGQVSLSEQVMFVSFIVIEGTLPGLNQNPFIQNGIDIKVRMIPLCNNPH